MSSINVSWSDSSMVEYYNLYRSTTSINISTLPIPIISNIADKFYNDTDVINGQTYYYIVESILRGQHKFSEQIIVVASDTINLELYISGESKNSDDTKITNYSSVYKNIIPRYDTKIVSSHMIESGFSYLSNCRLSYTDTNLGLSDFTAELWVNPRVINSMYAPFLSIGDNGINGLVNLSTYVSMSEAKARIEIYNGAYTTIVTSNKTLNYDNVYRHLCIMRKSGIFYLFVDGELQGSSNAYTTFNVTGSNVYVMGNNENSSTFNSYFGSHRLTKLARYDTQGFQKLKADYKENIIDDPFYESVSCLIKCKNNSFIDVSNNNKIINEIGTRTIFPAPVLTNGMVYIDGTADYFTTEIEPLRTTDFTFEMWISPANLQSSDWNRIFEIGAETQLGYIALYNVSNSNPLILSIYVNDSGTAKMLLSGTVPLINNEFNHVAIMRKSGIFYLFVNGAVSGTPHLYQVYDMTHKNLIFGTRNNNIGSNIFKGCYSNIRLTKRAILNTNGFTPIKQIYNKNIPKIDIKVENGVFKDHGTANIPWDPNGIVFENDELYCTHTAPMLAPNNNKFNPNSDYNITFDFLRFEFNNGYPSFMSSNGGWVAGVFDLLQFPGPDTDVAYKNRLMISRYGYGPNISSITLNDNIWYNIEITRISNIVYVRANGELIITSSMSGYTYNQIENIEIFKVPGTKVKNFKLVQ